MPDGFEYSGPSVHEVVFDPGYRDTEIVQAYSKTVSLNETVQLVFSYPAPEADPFTMGGMFPELVAPEDAVSEVEINGAAASLVRGTWSDETMRRIQRIELPLDPEWDYDGGYAITFTIDVPGHGRVRARLFSVFATTAVTGDDLIKIARSVVAVE